MCELTDINLRFFNLIFILVILPHYSINNLRFKVGKEILKIWNWKIMSDLKNYFKMFRGKKAIRAKWKQKQKTNLSLYFLLIYFRIICFFYPISLIIPKILLVFIRSSNHFNTYWTHNISCHVLKSLPPFLCLQHLYYWEFS